MIFFKATCFFGALLSVLGNPMGQSNGFLGPANPVSGFISDVAGTVTAFMEQMTSLLSKHQDQNPQNNFPPNYPASITPPTLVYTPTMYIPTQPNIQQAPFNPQVRPASPGQVQMLQVPASVYNPINAASIGSTLSAYQTNVAPVVQAAKQKGFLQPHAVSILSTVTSVPTTPTIPTQPTVQQVQHPIDNAVIKSVVKVFEKALLPNLGMIDLLFTFKLEILMHRKLCRWKSK